MAAKTVFEILFFSEVFSKGKLGSFDRTYFHIKTELYYSSVKQYIVYVCVCTFWHFLKSNVF